LKDGLHGGLCFPIKLGEQVLGVIECFSRQVRDPDEHFLKMLSAIGGQLGQFLQRKRAEEMRARLANIVESSEDAIISNNLEGLITSWNAGAERLFGYPAAEMLGQPLARIIPPDRLQEETTILHRLRSGEPVQHFETIRCAKDRLPINVSTDDFIY
jgi:PAS domain S-box-containing protein